MNTTGNPIRSFMLLMFFTWIVSLDATSISLKITDLDNNLLKEAGAGQPFLLQVIVKDAQNTAQYPDLQGIDNIYIRNAGFQMNMVNGNTSITYQYRVRIDTPGTYTLGPAQLTSNNPVVTSAPITVIVSGEQKSLDPKKGATAANTSTLLKLTCAQESVFVGQKVPCTLTFYTADPHVVLESLIEPDNTKQTLYRIKNKKEPVTGTQWINGVEYRCAQWQWDLYPLKAGQCAIPAYGAYYNNKSQRDMISLFFARPDQKRLYSNAITLNVQPLPASSHASSLIGQIISYTAQVEPHKAAVGHGIVVTLTAIGNVDFESLALVPLTHMPSQLKWYESKHTQELSKTHDGFIKHTMEYIVQGIEQGVWHIQPQELTYFGPQERAYKTTKTEQLTLTITPAPHTNTIPIPANPVDTASMPDTIMPLTHNRSTSALAQGLPIPVFWAIVCCLIAVWFGITLCSINASTLMRFKRRWYKTKHFSHARATVAAIQKNHRAQELYPTFITLLTTISNLSPTQITPEQINQHFAARGMSKQLQQDWRTFFSQLLETAFYSPSPKTPCCSTGMQAMRISRRSLGEGGFWLWRNSAKQRLLNRCALHNSSAPSVDNHLIEQALYWITVIEKLS